MISKTILTSQAILTLLICSYIIGTTLSLHNLYNAYAVLALHVLMLIFWITDLGLVANLARLWNDSDYYYSYYYVAYYDDYDYYYKRDIANIAKRDTTTVGAYRGALIAGAVFAALQLYVHITQHDGLGAKSNIDQCPLALVNNYDCGLSEQASFRVRGFQPYRTNPRPPCIHWRSTARGTEIRRGSRTAAAGTIPTSTTRPAYSAAGQLPATTICAISPRSSPP
jgi:hypothetical protein